MTESEMRLHRCCFTGHRPQKLNRSESAIKKDLEASIAAAVKDGFTTFITGMAYGVDIWAGEIVVRLRKKNPNLRLIAAVPFEGFESRWSSEWKQDYTVLLGQADLVKYICPTYNPGAYQRRNEWMVNHSARVIAVFNGEKSGTKNTVDYAISQSVDVDFIEA